MGTSRLLLRGPEALKRSTSARPALPMPAKHGLKSATRPALERNRAYPHAPSQTRLTRISIRPAILKSSPARLSSRPLLRKPILQPHDYRLNRLLPAAISTFHFAPQERKRTSDSSGLDNSKTAGSQNDCPDFLKIRFNKGLVAAVVIMVIETKMVKSAAENTPAS